MADRLTREQAAAVRPSRSAWISANAGSGKTRVLTARVARCLLEGVRPDRILCLTYTRAAAGEMKTRLFATLGGWAMCSDETLRADLAGLLEPDEKRVFDDRSLANARRLFAQALEYPGGLKIQTIHSFGLSLLRRFPREAGLSPGVAILDERRMEALVTRAFEETLREARDDGGRLGAAYRTLVAGGRASTLEALRSSILQHRSAYQGFAARHDSDSQAAAFHRFLGDENGAAEADALAALAGLHEQADPLAQVAEIVRSIGKTQESKRVPHLCDAIEAIRSGDEEQTVRHLRKGLLNKDSSHPQKPFTKGRQRSDGIQGPVGMHHGPLADAGRDRAIPSNRGRGQCKHCRGAHRHGLSGPVHQRQARRSRSRLRGRDRACLRAPPPERGARVDPVPARRRNRPHPG